MHPSTRVRFADAHVAPLEGDRYPSQDLLPSLLRPARGRTAHGLRPGLTAGVLACFGWIASGRRCSRNGASGIRVRLTRWRRRADRVPRAKPAGVGARARHETRSRGLTKTVHVGNNVNEKQEKQMVSYCAYTCCTDATTTDDPARSVERDCSDDTTYASGP